MNNGGISPIILTLIDEVLEPTLGFLERMIQTPSENPPGNYEAIANCISDQFRDWGLEVALIETPTDLLPENDFSSPRLNVLGSIEAPEPGPSVILLAHLDTVPVGDVSLWKHPPFSGYRQDGKIYGRGAVDCKGRLAAYGAAARVLAQGGLLKKGKLIVAATCDEETGGKLGTGYLVAAGHLDGNFAIVEGYGDRIVRAMSGVLWCDIIVKGKAVHAAYREQGVNAIEKARWVLEALYELNEELAIETSKTPGIKQTTINVGLIEGGTRPNVVAESCRLSLDIRIMPEHTLEGIYRRLLAKLERLRERGIEWEVIPFWGLSTEPTSVSEDNPVIQALRQASKEVNGVPLPVVGVPIQSDARYLLQQGIEAVNYGPGRPENGIHGLNEYLEVKDLKETVTILVQALGILLGG